MDIERDAAAVPLFSELFSYLDGVGSCDICVRMSKVIQSVWHSVLKGTERAAETQIHL